MAVSEKKGHWQETGDTTGLKNIGDKVAFAADRFFVNTLDEAPVTANDPGIAGEVRITATGIFICVATDSWLVANLSPVGGMV